MQNNEVSVACTLNINLDYVDTDAKRLLNGKDCVPRSVASSTAMADAKATHGDAIMTESIHCRSAWNAIRTKAH